MLCPVHNVEMELRMKKTLTGATICHFWCGECKTVYRVTEDGYETLFEKPVRDNTLGQTWVKVFPCPR